MKFKSDIEVQAGIKDSAGNPGTTGQVLSSNGTTVSWIDGDSDTAHTVLNQVKAGVAINKGQAVYVTSADGTNIIVGLASNTSEATSSKTLGLLDATVAINGFANVVQIGRLSGLNIQGAVSEGDPVWLGQNGNLIYGLLNKPYAPEHLVFIGIVTRVNSNNGEIFVNVQNGFELNEIHDVDIKTNVPINGDILGYDGTLWVNKTVAEWLGYTPVPDTRTITINGITQDLSADQTWTVEGGIGGSGTVDTLPKFTAATVVGDSQIKDSGTNVSIGYPVNPDIYKVDIAGTFRNSIPSLTGGQTIISAIDGGSNAYSIDIDVNDNITHLWSTGFGTTSMFINPNGFVSIGGTSSLARFNVLGNMFAGSMLFNNANISALSGLNFSVSTNSLERMRIFSSGNVFIGSSPVDAGYKLDVNGKLNVRDGLTGYLSGLNSYRTYAAAAQFQISSYQSKGTANYTKTMDIVANSDNGADSEIRFLTKAYYATEPQEQMRIDRFGSVSIGNTTGYTGFGLLNVSNNSYLNEIWTQQGLWFGSFSEGAANTFIYGEGANTGGQFLDFGVNFSTRIRIFDGGNVGIGVLTDAGYKLDVNGGVKINGLSGIGTRTVVADANGVLSTTTDGAITTYNSTLTLDTTWKNTGVTSANLTTQGVYLVTCFVNDYGVGGGQYSCTYVGTMFFYTGGTNGVNTNEIALHHSGHADNNRYIYLRTLSSVSAGDGKLYLQIKGNGSNSANSTYAFTFKKLL